MSTFYSIIQMGTISHFKGILYVCLAVILSISTSYSQQGLKAEYYDGTDFNRLEAVKYVPNIDQSWFSNPPVPNIDPHECSIRWTGKLKPEKSGTYSFSAQVDDGIRVWIDDQQIIDQWELNDVGVFEGTMDLEANHEYNLKVEYFNGLLEGEIRLMWKKHKDELSWYERIFGDGIIFSVITAEYFLPPDEPITIEKKIIEEVKKEPLKKKPLAIQVKKKTTVQKTKQKPASSPAKEVNKPELPKPAVSAKTAEKFIPKNVQFDKGKTIILESSYSELNAFIQFMVAQPQLQVMVEGHTDVIGDAELNLQLSKDRAQVIADYLQEKGINVDRIKSEGYGGTRPLVVPDKGRYHPANRRVVFIVEGY